MQKFKITKQQIKDAGYMPAIPETCSEYLIFEGELLEGGTVEKCCVSYFVNSVHAVNCHNNKEEECDGCKREGKKAERFLHMCGRFNRETPKVPERCCRHFEDNFCFCTHFCHQAYLKSKEYPCDHH